MLMKNRMKIPKIKNLRKKVKNFPKILAQRAFLTFFLFLFFFLILGGLIYYKYLILEMKKEPELSQRVFEFNQKNYQKVLEILDEKEKKFNSIGLGQFRDPFETLQKTETSTTISLPSP